MTGERVSLGDVAAKSGVSKATASRALNARDGVRPDVRDRVLIVAKSLGYRPNRAAKNLRGGRASLLGLVLGSSDISRDQYGASLLHAVSMAAERRDEGLMLLMNSKEPSDAVRDVVKDGLIDGVVVSSAAINVLWVEELLDAEVPTVTIGSHQGRPDVHAVTSEGVESSARVVGHLLDTSGPRICHISGPRWRSDVQDRVAGYRLAHTRRGLTVDDELVLEGDFTWDSAYNLADELFGLGADGVFCANDEMAHAVIRRAAELDIDIPGEFGVAGYDGTHLSTRFGPRLTTVRQPFEQLGTVLVETVIALVSGIDVPLKQVVEPDIYFGKTTRSPAPFTRS